MTTPDRLKILLDAYGADPERWPERERAAARELLARAPEVQAPARRAAALDAALDAAPLAAPPGLDPAALAARVMRLSARAAAAATSWRFSFGWPNFATLAAAAALGLVIGWTDIETTAQSYSGNDVLEKLSPVAAAENPLW